MRRYASLLLSFLLTVALLCAMLASACPAYAQANPTDAQVRQIIDRMGNNSFPERQKASGEMDALIRQNRLTPAQLGILRTYGGANADPEIRQRANRSLTTWANTVPAANQIFTSSRILVTNVSPVGDTFYEFDSVYGVAGNAAQNRTGIELSKKSESVRNAMANGDPGATKQALTDLKKFVDDNFNNLDLYTDPAHTKMATRQQLADKLQAAINAADAAAAQIGQGAGNAPPPPRPNAPMNGPGVVNDTGKTIGLTLLTAPAIGGSVEIFLPPDGFALSLPPTGLEFVGSVVDVLPLGELNITGTVRVSMAYDGDLFSSASPDEQTSWQLVRIVNGRIMPMDNVFNDTTNFILSGEYTPPSAIPGENQFGEFAIVRAAQTAAPEPGSAILMLGICLCAGIRPFVMPRQDRYDSGS
jgi:hypothetical protein